MASAIAGAAGRIIVGAVGQRGLRRRLGPGGMQQRLIKTLTTRERHACTRPMSVSVLVGVRRLRTTLRLGRLLLRVVI
jgi:hypothetical protein